MKPEITNKIGELIPEEKVMLSAKDISLILRYEPKYFRQDIATQKTFPKPFKLKIGNRKSGLRWKATEVLDWIEKNIVYETD